MAGLFGGSTGVGVSKSSKGDGTSTYDPFGTAKTAKDQSRMAETPDNITGVSSSTKSSGGTTTAEKSLSASKSTSAFESAFSAVAGATPQTLTAEDRASVTRNMTNQTQEERQAALAAMNGKVNEDGRAKVSTSKVTEDQLLPSVPAYTEEPIAASRQVGAASTTVTGEDPTAAATARGGLAPSRSLSMTGQAPIAGDIASAFQAVQQQPSATVSAWDASGNPLQGSTAAQGTPTREAALSGSLPNAMYQGLATAPQPSAPQATTAATQTASAATSSAPAVSAWTDDGEPLGIGTAATGVSTREAALNGSLPGGLASGLSMSAAPEAIAASTKSTEKTDDNVASAKSTSPNRSTSKSSSSTAATSKTAAATTQPTASTQQSSGGGGSQVSLSGGGMGTNMGGGLAVANGDDSGRYSPTASGNSGSSSGSSSCYITTAAMLGAEADDGPTLTVLRRFRDAIMAPRDDWRADIATYYATAPAIVERIDASAKREKVYAIIRRRVLAPCVRMIEAGQYDGAHRLYRRMVSFLGRANLGD